MKKEFKNKTGVCPLCEIPYDEPQKKFKNRQPGVNVVCGNCERKLDMTVEVIYEEDQEMKAS